MNRYKALLSLGFILFSMACTAQDITDVEAKPYGSYTGGKIDTVDLATGNLMLNIPLISYPQRGSLPPLSFSVELNNAPYSQTGWTCDPSGNTFSSTNPNYQIECEAYSSRYDTSPPGAVFQVNQWGAMGIVAQPVDETIWFTYADCNAHLQGQTGQPCGFEDTWGAESLPYAMQNIGAYITSSYAGGIVTAQLENSGCGQNGTSCGAYQYSMVDPSGTTHELDSDASNAPYSWNIYHTADGSGYTFIPSNTPYSTPAGSENAYNVLAPADGWNWSDSNADWLGIPSADGSSAPSAVRLGTLYSPTGIMYSDTIVPYSIPATNYYYRNIMPFYTPRALYSVAQDPAGNHITRGPWYWSGYYSKGDPFADIASIYAGLSAPASGYTPGPYYIDSVGRIIPDILAMRASTYGQLMPWKVPGPNNSQLTYTFSYVKMGNTVNFVPGQLPGNPDPSTDISAWGWAINSITLPNNTQWSFSYSNSTADLTEIQI